MPAPRSAPTDAPAPGEATADAQTDESLRGHQEGEQAEVSPPVDQVPPATPVIDSRLDDAMRELRRPFTAEAVRFKVQVNPKDDNGSALCVGYIDARLVSERFNAVVPGLWSHTYVSPPTPNASAVGCRIKLTIPTLHGEQTITREDVGWAGGGHAPTSDNGFKGMYSDALKRAAVHFGIGVSMYAFPQQWVKATDLKKRGDKWQMTDTAENKLRANYRAWIQSVESIFGKPLSHGDAEGAAGDIDVDAREVVDMPEWGLSAESDAQLGQYGKALTFLVDVCSPDTFDGAARSDIVVKAREKIEAKFGYVPLAATTAVGLIAGEIKKALDSATKPSGDDAAK